MNRLALNRREAAMAEERKTDIIIRADGNARIGAGHLMRCLTIAEEIRHKERVVFWCADQASAELAESRGYIVRVLGTDYRDMLSELPRWEAWAQQEQEKPESLRPTILVDSYYVNAEYLQALRAYGRVCLLDDMQQQAWPVDGVINYNAFAQRESYERLYAGQDRLAGETALYIGPAYVPLRPQFIGRKYQVQEQVKEILITTGGGDLENIAGQILERIVNTECRIHVVSGPYHPHGAWLEEYALRHPHVTVHRQVTEMAALMEQCDLAITAGGTTVYELCALGVPFICFSYAENQEALAEYAGRQGIGRNAGKYHREPEKVLAHMAELVRETMADETGRREMSRKARALVDGGGARRLAEVLETDLITGADGTDIVG